MENEGVAELKRLANFSGGVVDGEDAFNDSKRVVSENVAIGCYNPAISLVEVTKMKGNFWKVSGFSVQQRNFLYPEEALYLAEKCALKILDTEKAQINFTTFYQLVVAKVTLPGYLTYAKLRNLDYITFRHRKQVKCFGGDDDVYNYLKANPTMTLLDSLVSYDVHPYGSNFSKNVERRPKPVSYVVVMSSRSTLSARVILRLLEEAKGVPILMSAMMPTGHIILEEFTDALQSLDWSNVYAIPFLGEGGEEEEAEGIEQLGGSSSGSGEMEVEGEGESHRIALAGEGKREGDEDAEGEDEEDEDEEDEEDEGGEGGEEDDLT